MAASVASALDMTLDDVIKIKGKRGGGRGPKKSISGNQATGRKPAVEAKTVETGKEDTKAAAEKPADKTGETKGGGSGGVRRLRRVTAAQALAPAAKAAAAAAKATATAAKQPPVAARSVRVPAVVGGAKGTEEKLAMSLEDLLKFEVKKRKPKPEKIQKSAGGPNEGSGAKRGTRRKVMKLRATPRGKARAKAKGKAKAKAKAQVRGRGRLQDDGSWRTSREFSNMSSWGSQDGRRRPSGGSGGMYADWNTGSKRKAADDWGPFPDKRVRAVNDARRNSFGWGRSNNDSSDDRWSSGNRGSSWGGGSGALSLSGSGSYRPSDRWGNSDSWGGSSSSDRGAGGAGGWTRTLARTWGGGGSDWGSAAKSSARRVWRSLNEPVVSRSCRIRVSNVPKNLDWRDIKEAFEDNGRVTRCEVERGVAWVTFESSLDAKKAVQTFDRGELNGQTIFVTHE